MWVIWIEKRPYFYHISEKYLLSYDFHCLNSLVTYHLIIIGTKLKSTQEIFQSFVVAPRSNNNTISKIWIQICC